MPEVLQIEVLRRVGLAHIEMDDPRPHDVGLGELVEEGGALRQRSRGAVERPAQGDNAQLHETAEWH